MAETDLCLRLTSNPIPNITQYDRISSFYYFFSFIAKAVELVHFTCNKVLKFKLWIYSRFNPLNMI